MIVCGQLVRDHISIFMVDGARHFPLRQKTNIFLVLQHHGTRLSTAKAGRALKIAKFLQPRNYHSREFEKGRFGQTLWWMNMACSNTHKKRKWIISESNDSLPVNGDAESKSSYLPVNGDAVFSLGTTKKCEQLFGPTQQGKSASTTASHWSLQVFP